MQILIDFLFWVICPLIAFCGCGYLADKTDNKRYIKLGLFFAFLAIYCFAVILLELIELITA